MLLLAARSEAFPPEPYGVPRWLPAVLRALARAKDAFYKPRRLPVL
jgi:hypothetical protein